MKHGAKPISPHLQEREASQMVNRRRYPGKKACESGIFIIIHSPYVRDGMANTIMRLVAMREILRQKGLKNKVSEVTIHHPTLASRSTHSNNHLFFTEWLTVVVYRCLRTTFAPFRARVVGALQFFFFSVEQATAVCPLYATARHTTLSRNLIALCYRQFLHVSSCFSVRWTGGNVHHVSGVVPAL